MQGSTGDTASNIDGRKLQCPECNRRFIRPEHMRRHLRNHDTSKRFTCHVCSKKFTRRFRPPCIGPIDLFNMLCANAAVSDILSKHRAAHVAGPLEVSDYPHSNHSVPSKSRACYACAKAREKCSKGLPCMRCSRRCLNCVYPEHQQQDKYDQRSIGRNYSAPRLHNTENIPATDLALTPETLQENLGDISGKSHTLTDLVFDQTQSGPGDAFIISTEQCTTAIQNSPWASIAVCPTSNTQLSSILASDSDPSGSAQQWLLQNDGLESGAEVPNQPINWLPFDELIDPKLGCILDETISLSQYDGAPWPFINTSTIADGSPQGESWNLRIPPLTDIGDKKYNNTSQNTPGPGSSPSMSTSSSNYKRGDLYATSSNGARNACSTRAKRYAIFRTNEHPHTDNFNKGSIVLNKQSDFQDFGHMDVPDDDIYDPAMAISDFTYDTILQHFNNICLQMQSHMPCFGTQNFPPLTLLNLFVKLYFKCFDPILPFIHLPSLDMNKSCVLVVAIAAIGSHYCRSHELTACSSPLHEFCRRLLQQEFERSEEGIAALPVLQARLLNHIGLCYSESRKIDSIGRSIWSFNLSLVNSQSRENLLRYRNDRVLKSRDWGEWVGAESWRRLYFTTRV